MRNRVTGKALRVVAIVGLMAGAAALSGCTALGSRAFGDRTVTGSVGQSSPGNLSQPMPKTLGPANTRVASGPFIPPSDIGGGSPGTMVTGAVVNPGSKPMGSVQTADLPVLASSNSGNAQMSAQPQLAPVVAAPKTVLASVPASTSAPALTAVPADAYVHVIASGESLYTIARLYNVTAQAIVSANGLSSPDKIYVGQKVVIPGMKGSGAPKAATVTAAAPAVKGAATQAPTVVAEVKPNDSTPIASPKLIETNTPVNKPLVQPKAEPILSGADKFRWPVSGRVITDFGNSKGTGINIEAPEGAAIRAAENGQVIYVGSGVEGYGNLILIRHPNGYVSAYAHLKDMSVTKGAVVNRGDNIGTAGMTGGVSRPQLHFELRKGATPVDPVPLLAS